MAAKGKGFRQFVLRGNVVDLAVGIVIGAAFTGVVNAFVKAFLTPLIGLATGNVGDFSARTVRVAGTDFPYGAFINNLIAFILTAMALYYFVVEPANRLLTRFQGEPDLPPTPKRDCPECLSSIPVGARRCAFCTAILHDEFEDKDKDDKDIVRAR
ncbi:large conductance mechanosensitive channel protein MscL [Catenulispora yoronensis]|uniref:Large conductance mechanosensitive channel protein MscL n=1 Tax=Catenulispora yoronensis TaxID=450799 RepID=A0ABP5F3J0_9ACTN